MHKLDANPNDPGNAEGYSFWHADTDVEGGGPGWHLLGKVKKGGGYGSVDEMIEGADLHQPVGKYPLSAKIVVDGVVVDEAIVEDKVAAGRINPHTGRLQVLGVIGPEREIFQPRESFGFAQNLIDSGEAIGVTAGSMCNGSQIFAAFKLPQQIQIGGVDRHDLYLGIVDSFDSSRKFTAAITPIRFECFNTVCLGTKSAVRTWELKHIAGADPNSDANLERARQALTLSNKYVEAWKREAEKLLSRKLPAQRFEMIITEQFGPKMPNPSKRTEGLWQVKKDHLMTLLKAPNLSDVEGTAWAAWNAYVEWSDWYKSVRGADDNETAQNAARFSRSFTNMGGNEDIEKVRFQKVLLAATS